MRAREIQLRRYGMPNARATGREIDEHARIEAEARRLIRDAGTRLGLSNRAHHRVLKVARTIADLDESADVLGDHVAEAIRYRG